MSQPIGNILVFDLPDCSGTILPGEETGTFVLCLDGHNGKSFRVRVDRNGGFKCMSDFPPSWLEVVMDLVSNVKFTSNTSAEIDDGVVTRHNVRLMEIHHPA